MRRTLTCAATAALLGCVASGPVQPDPPPRFAEYAGVYVDGPLALTEIAAVDGYIAAVPPFWGSRPYLSPVDGAPDTFAFTLPGIRPERRITFQRDAGGRIASLVLSGVDGRYDGKAFARLPFGAETPATEFMDRRPQDAAEAALADPELTLADLREFALDHFTHHPSRIADTLAFLERVHAARPEDPRLEVIRARVLVAAGRRAEARAVLARALELAPDDEPGREVARRLALTEPAPGQGYRKLLPFSLAEAFAPPTPAEIAQVRASWKARDLSAHGVEIVRRATVAREHATYDVVILRHEVGGAVHYGALWAPRGSDRPLPVLLDARGVNPSYSPMDVSQGTEFLDALGEHQPDFLVVVPAMNGHTLVFQGEEFVAGGDPSDSWEGATDATLALLNAVLSIGSRADPRRIAITGHSRGGAVALLAAERDPRITLVLSIAGPVDHFEAMQPYMGFRWEELLADAMSDGEPPTLEDEAGQKFDHFFDRVLTGGESLADVRRRMIASSALYFARDLPETHACFGAEDRSVPVANAVALRARLAELGRLDRDTTVRVFEGRGHDTDPYPARVDAVRWLTEWAKR